MGISVHVCVGVCGSVRQCKCMTVWVCIASAPACSCAVYI